MVHKAAAIACAAFVTGSVLQSRSVTASMATWACSGLYVRARAAAAWDIRDSRNKFTTVAPCSEGDQTRAQELAVAKTADPRSHFHSTSLRAPVILPIMRNPLENAEQLDAFSEVYEVVRTAEVVMDRDRYRIEILKGYSNPNVPYSTRCCRQEIFVLEEAEQIENGKRVSGHVTRTTWVETDLPWTSKDTPDSALSQALAFLARGKNPGR